MTAPDLPETEYAPFYAGYVSLVPPHLAVAEALQDSTASLLTYLRGVDSGRQDFAYAPGKWTIKQSLQHVVDTDRIFAYRALRLARRDTTPLPGFEQDDYADRADVSTVEFSDLIAEFRDHRQSLHALFRGFSEEGLAFTGTVSGRPMSCRAMGFIAAGHAFHHRAVYTERYG
ncbi:MAG: DinB family protein [Lewinella sp.]